MKRSIDRFDSYRFRFIQPVLVQWLERLFVEQDTIVRFYHSGPIKGTLKRTILGMRVRLPPCPPIHSGVAQLVAQVTLNHKVVGSTPASRAKFYLTINTV